MITRHTRCCLLEGWRTGKQKAASHKHRSKPRWRSRSRVSLVPTSPRTEGKWEGHSFNPGTRHCYFYLFDGGRADASWVCGWINPCSWPLILPIAVEVVPGGFMLKLYVSMSMQSRSLDHIDWHLFMQHEYIYQIEVLTMIYCGTWDFSRNASSFSLICKRHAFLSPNSFRFLPMTGSSVRISCRFKRPRFESSKMDLKRTSSIPKAKAWFNSCSIVSGT